MQTARCTADNRQYTASEYALLTEAEKTRVRGHLVCVHCAEPAYFRRPTVEGHGQQSRSACFFCRPHGANCEITRVNDDPWESAHGDDAVARWEQQHKTVIVQIRNPSESVEDTHTNPTGPTSEGERTRSSGGSSTGSQPLRSGPQRLLERLVTWPSFKTSALTIKLPDAAQTMLPAHQAFVRFQDADPDRHTQHCHGFWGIMPRLSFWTTGELYYANFGTDLRDFRIAIDLAHVPEILARFGLSRIEDISGHYLIVFATARITTTSRFTAEVLSPHHIGFLRLPRP